MDHNTNTGTNGTLSNAPQGENKEQTNTITPPVNPPTEPKVPPIELTKEVIQGQKPTPSVPLDRTIKGNPNSYVVVSFGCAIRRKADLVGLPGEDPHDRNYKVGSSLDSQTGKSLKGITGVVEALLMPEMLSTNKESPEFREAVNIYWANISVPIPADNVNLKDHEKGKVCNVKFHVAHDFMKKEFDAVVGVEAKIKELIKLLEKGEAHLDYDFISDFLLLAYCIKYSRVANRIEDVEKSGKIMFYLFEKSSSIATKLSTIELRETANRIFTVIQKDEIKLNAVLLAFGDLPNNYDDISEKIIAVDEYYNTNMASLKLFIKTVEDPDLDTKYLIMAATAANKLTNPANTETYYYNSRMLGTNLREAVLFLNGDSEDARAIKGSLKRELGLYNK